MLRTTAPLIGALALIGDVVRYLGRITDWNDDKGFGFIAPNGGGSTIFVHINAFSRLHGHRPTGGDLVNYEIQRDARGRSEAVNVALVGDRKLVARAVPATSGIGAKVLIVTFFAFVAVMVAKGKLHYLILIAYIMTSCAAYLIYAFDKAAAIQGSWRTQESTLHIVSLLGGWPGAFLAQRKLHHKTRKHSFLAIYWITVALNCAGLGWVMSPEGTRFISTLLYIA